MSGGPSARDAHQLAQTRRDTLIQLLYFALWTAILGVLVYVILKWLLPFVFALAVALVLQKPLKFLVKKTGVSKPFFSVVLVALVIALLAGIVVLASWWAVTTAINFFSNPANMEKLQQFITGVTASVQEAVDRLTRTLSSEARETIRQALSNLSQQMLDMLTGLFANAAGGLIGFLTKSLPSLLVAWIVWVLASVFLTTDFDKVKGFFARQLPPRMRSLCSDAKSLCGQTLGKMLRAYLLLMLITFAELSAGLLLLKIPFAIPVAAGIALVDILPVLGTGTILLPWIAVLLLTGEAKTAIGMLLIYLIITVVRNILEPRLVSRQIGLNPLLTLFGMYLGLQAFGLIGMLVLPVVLMVLKCLHDDGKLILWH